MTALLLLPRAGGAEDFEEGEPSYPFQQVQQLGDSEPYGVILCKERPLDISIISIDGLSTRYDRSIAARYAEEIRVRPGRHVVRFGFKGRPVNREEWQREVEVEAGKLYEFRILSTAVSERSVRGGVKKEFRIEFRLLDPTNLEEKAGDREGLAPRPRSGDAGREL